MSEQQWTDLKNAGMPGILPDPTTPTAISNGTETADPNLTVFGSDAPASGDAAPAAAGVGTGGRGPDQLPSAMRASPGLGSNQSHCATDPPGWLFSDNTQRNSTTVMLGGAARRSDPGAETGPSVRFHQDVVGDSEHRLPVVGRGWDQTPSVLSSAGSGADGYMQPPRNIFSTPVISDSDRARHQQGERARDQNIRQPSSWTWTTHRNVRRSPHEHATLVTASTSSPVEATGQLPHNRPACRKQTRS